MLQCAYSWWICMNVWWWQIERYTVTQSTNTSYTTVNDTFTASVFSTIASNFICKQTLSLATMERDYKLNSKWKRTLEEISLYFLRGITKNWVLRNNAVGIDSYEYFIAQINKLFNCTTGSAVRKLIRVVYLNLHKRFNPYWV